MSPSFSSSSWGQEGVEFAHTCDVNPKLSPGKESRGEAGPGRIIQPWGGFHSGMAGARVAGRFQDGILGCVVGEGVVGTKS